MARTRTSRLSSSWSSMSSTTNRMLRAVTSLTGRIFTWLENHVNQNRTGYSRRRDRQIMTRQFHAALNTCHKHNKISKKEMKEAKRRWEEAIKKVKKEDKRREELWEELI